MKKILSVFMAIVLSLSVMSCISVVGSAALDSRQLVSVEFSCIDEPEIFEGFDGYYANCDCPDCTSGIGKYFDYSFYSAISKSGNAIVLRYDDNSSVEYIADGYDFYSSTGEYLDYYLTYEGDQGEEHLEPDTTATVTISVDDKVCYVPVRIRPTKVKSVAFTYAQTPELIENYYGYWDETKTNFYYEEWPAFYKVNDYFTVTYNDGTVEKYVCNDDGDSYYCDNKYLVMDFITDQDVKPWKLGNTYTIQVLIYGKFVSVPVKIVENPISSISFASPEPLRVHEDGDYMMWEDDNGELYKYYYLTGAFYAEGNSLTVNYKSGKKDVYSYDATEDAFVNSKGEIYNIDWIDTQYNNHWQVGKTYNVTVIAFGRECVVPVSVAAAKPDTPKAITTNEISGVNVTWNKVEGATKYNVYRRQGGYKTWTLVGTTTGNTLLDKNVKSGVYYCYSVRAYNSLGKYSDFVQANTQTRKYMATPKLTTIYNHVNGLAIKWNAVAGVTNGYRVYRRGAGSTYWTYLGTTKNLYFIDNGVKNASGGYYRYTVIADGGYHSKFDTTGLYLKRLANPALTSAVSSTSGITVKWGAVKGTTGYYVYRKTANSSWVRVAAVGGTNNTTFLDKTAKKGTTYTYTVRAVYGATTSAYNAGISCYDKY